MEKLSYYPLLLLFTGKKTSAGRIKYFTFFISILALFAACNSTSASGPDSSQKKAMTVGEIERSQPTNFLTVDEVCMGIFLSNTIKVHGLIKNKATVTSYKDAVVRVTYYSNTKTELGTKDYTIHDVFPANSEVKVELDVEYYKAVNTIGWDVVQATAN